MSQYNFGVIVANTKSGSALAADLNAWRDAVHSSHKGKSTPTYKVAGLNWWSDTNTPWEDYVWDGNASILRGFIDPATNRYASAGNHARSVSTNSLMHLSDWGTLLNCTGSSAQTVAIDTKGTLLPGWWFRVVARNVNVTISPYGAETIDGAANKLLDAGSSTTIFYDGANLYSDQYGGGLTDFPVGGLVWVPAGNAPAGFLKCNGAVISRATYAGLWGFANASGNIVAEASWVKGRFTSGDGSTNLRIPDLRGEFVRSWDNSLGQDPGRLLGTVQNDEFQSHAHTATITSGGSHNHTFTNGVTDAEGNHTHSMAASEDDQGDPTRPPKEVRMITSPDEYWGNVATNPAGGHSHTVSGTISNHAGHTHPITVNAFGSTETRPRNVAMLACIKY